VRYHGFDDGSAPGGRFDPMQHLRIAHAATPSWEVHKAPMSATTSSHSRPLLLVGMPRSGTTWTMRVLGTDPNLHPLMEPDNEGTSAPALWGKKAVGRFPALQPGDHDQRYHGLWSWILAGAPRSLRLRFAAQILGRVQRPGRTRFLQGRRVPLMTIAGAIASHPGKNTPSELRNQRLLVKSVHAPLALEWLAEEFEFDVLVLLRHPGNVLASWLALDLNEQFVRLEENPAVRSQLLKPWGVTAPGPDPLERMIFSIGVLSTALEAAASRNPRWLVRTHEQLCSDPGQEFKKLYADLGLSWSEEVDGFLVGNDRPGKGFITQRVAAELPDNWKRRLTSHQVVVMQRVLSQFPLKTWSAEDFHATGV
jgi:Sulfotransferase family